MTQMPPTPPGTPTNPLPVRKGKGLAIAALVLGIVTIFIPPILKIPVGLAAIIVGIVSVATGRPGKAMAVAGIAIPPLIVLLIILLMPALHRAMELARRSICAENLKAISKQVAIYTVMHEEPPADIDALIRQGASEKMFECPSSPGTKKCDYFFHFPKEEPEVGSAIVGCDYQGNHPDGRSVLTYQGSVKFIKGEAAFQAELAEPQNAEFAEALRAAEGP